MRFLGLRGTHCAAHSSRAHSVYWLAASAFSFRQLIQLANVAHLHFNTVHRELHLTYSTSRSICDTYVDEQSIVALLYLTHVSQSTDDARRLISNIFVDAQSNIVLLHCFHET